MRYLSDVTVLQFVQWSCDLLARQGVESPRLQAEWLLAHVLVMPRLNLCLDFNRILSEAEIRTAKELVTRRAAREPLQHIIGTTSFCGFEIEVTSDVLVPRPETELLAETAWEHLAELSAGNSRSPNALDFGTGSGCLAIAMAGRFPELLVSAIDISAEALRIAARNTGRNGVANRIEFFHGDGFGALQRGIRFDFIVSNPPYIPTAEIESLEKEVREFDPRASLDGGADGLDFYRRLAREAVAFLKPGGRMALEFGDGQAESILAIFHGVRWRNLQIRKDYSGRDRIFIAHPPEP